MPKVSDDHVEQRRRQILDAARRCFGRKGFHRTSMQDVFAESGLSAGAVYRYFKSKDDIIRAIAGEGQTIIAGLVEEMLEEDPLPPLSEVVRRFCERVESLLEEDGPMRVAPEGWAEATHNPVIGPLVRRLFTDTRDCWIRLAERMRDAGRLPPDADTYAVGATLLCVMPGFVLQRMLLGDVDATTVEAGFRALTGANATV